MTQDGTSKRVLFLFTEVFANGGIQRFNQTLLNACAGLNLSGQVLSLKDSPAAIAKQRTGRDILLTGFSGNRAQFAAAVTGTLVRYRFDWVLVGHVNFLSMVVSLSLLKAYAKTPLMLVAHGIEIWSGIGAVRQRALARTQRILCVSRYTRQRILEQAPRLAAGKLTIFPNALADSWNRPAPFQFTRPLPARFVLSVTRLERGDRYKGVVSVIEALSMLADTEMQFLVVGHGDDLDFLKMVARRCGVEDRVHFLGGVSDAELIALYEKCAAFVLPSGKEGFGIVFLEAMRFGAPVIAAKEKGVLDVITDGETGLLVRFGDTIAIKDAIDRLASDSALRERLRANGRSMVTDGGPFTFTRFAERWAQVLEVGQMFAA